MQSTAGSPSATVTLRSDPDQTALEDAYAAQLAVAQIAARLARRAAKLEPARRRGPVGLNARRRALVRKLKAAGVRSAAGLIANKRGG